MYGALPLEVSLAGDVPVHDVVARFTSIREAATYQVPGMLHHLTDLYSTAVLRVAVASRKQNYYTYIQQQQQ